MFWRIVPFFVKPVAAVALFELVSRLAAITGLRLGLIDRIAGGVAGITGADPRYAAFLVLTLITGSLYKLVSAVCGVLATSRGVRHG